MNLNSFHFVTKTMSTYNLLWNHSMNFKLPADPVYLQFPTTIIRLFVGLRRNNIITLNSFVLDFDRHWYESNLWRVCIKGLMRTDMFVILNNNGLNKLPHLLPHNQESCAITCRVWRILINLNITKERNKHTCSYHLTTVLV